MMKNLTNGDKKKFIDILLQIINQICLIHGILERFLRRNIISGCDKLWCEIVFYIEAQSLNLY